jgi:DNA-directed RNA polymerase subunit RPC12/RpoP
MKITKEMLYGKFMICHYCGHRNLITNPKCTTCGATLKNVVIRDKKGKRIGEVIKDDKGQIVNINSSAGCITLLLFIPLLLITILVFNKGIM